MKKALLFVIDEILTFITALTAMFSAKRSIEEEIETAG